jgi:hypothetical protein
VKLVLLFLLMCFLGGVGGALGSMAGHALGPGGLFIGGALGGAALVVAGAWLATRWRWILPPQRVWTLVGALIGFALAIFVTLSTLSSPVGPAFSTILIGLGAVLGSRIGTRAQISLDT